MSPRNTTPRTSAAPYPRRVPGQPKSSRQQFSACGACRMRRVRCDLKDLPMAAPGPHPPCSNCKERGLKCVDEFADVKAVKLLRRGRRLQQVEAIYGKVADDEPMSNHAQSIPSAPHSSDQNSSTIPQLKSEFFSSRFWRRFCMQRPILTDFSTRYFAHLKGAPFLSAEGRLLGMVLVAWAASFGVDESGVDIDRCDFSAATASTSSTGPDTIGASVKSRRQGERLLAPAASSSALPRHPHQRSRALRERTSLMVREILAHIDNLGILRHPTWDGVRVLLLVLGIAEDVQPPLDRLAMQEAALSQVYSLCSLASLSPPSSTPSSSTSAISPEPEAEVRARVFWYAHVHESITIGLRGGRLVFDEDDLEVFKEWVPAVRLPVRMLGGEGLGVGLGDGMGMGFGTGMEEQMEEEEAETTPTSLPSPVSPTFPNHSIMPYHGPQHEHHQHHPQQHQQGPLYHHDNNHRYPIQPPSHHRRHLPPPQPHLLSAHLFSLPLHLSTVCRKAHLKLTGPKARRVPVIDEEAVFQVWEGLERCWEEFESLRRGGGTGGGSGGGVGGLGGKEDVERFVGGWQIFIFECYNLIRESLKQRLLANSPPTSNGASSTSPSPSNSNSHIVRSPHSSHPNSPTASTFSPSNTANGNNINMSAALARLHAVGRRRCFELLPRVLEIIRRHVGGGGGGGDGSGLFTWDAGLVRDGCFFAAFLVAGGGDDLHHQPHHHHRQQQQQQKWLGKRDYQNGGSSSNVDGTAEMMISQDEGVEICLRALEEMQWGFSKSEERTHTVRMVWDLKRGRAERERGVALGGGGGEEEGGGYGRGEEMDTTGVGVAMESYGHQQQRIFEHQHHNHNNHGHHGGFVGKSMHLAPLLPPLSLIADPSTEPLHSHGGSNGHAHPHSWAAYTPPGTGTTMSGSPSTGRGSPVYTTTLAGPTINTVTFKAGDNTPMSGGSGSGGGGGGDFFVSSDMDTFTYNVPTSTTVSGECSDPSSGGGGGYSLRHGHGQGHDRHLSLSMASGMGGHGHGHGHGYLDPAVVFSAPTNTAATTAGGEDGHCPPFAGGFYH